MAPEIRGVRFTPVCGRLRVGKNFFHAAIITAPMATVVKAEDTTVIKRDNDADTTVIKKKDEVKVLPVPHGRLAWAFYLPTGSALPTFITVLFFLGIFGGNFAIFSL